MAPTSGVDGRAGFTSFAAELARREREVVFVTADAGGVEALRGWGMLAGARPDDGNWERAALEVLAGGDVVVVQHGQTADPVRAERDAVVLGGGARRVGVLAPREPPQHGTTRDLHDYLRRQRTFPTYDVHPALAIVTESSPKDAPTGPLRGDFSDCSAWFTKRRSRVTLSRAC